MSRLGLFKTLLRETLGRRRCDRVPEPDLVMDDAGSVAEFTSAGREDGIVAPTYIFHTAHISEVILPGETVVDLACGPATQLAMVARLNPRTRFIGVDLSENMLDQARRHAAKLGLDNLEFQLGDIAELKNFEDASVDAVISTLSLHHLPDDAHLRACFSETARILKPGGGVYLTDFARLKSVKSMRYFAYQHEALQKELFTIDYFNSLQAAFDLDTYRRCCKDYLDGRATLYAMSPMAVMMAIKSPARRQLDNDTKAALRELRAAMPTPMQQDFKDITMLFGKGKLKSNALT